MTKQKNLHKLMELRKIRMRIAEEAAIHQKHIHDAAAEAAGTAAGKIVQNDEKRRQREAAMYDSMTSRTVGRRELEDYQDALAAMDFQASHLQQLEEQAKLRMVEEEHKAREKAAEHVVRLRQHDKLHVLLDRQSAKQTSRTNLLDELEDEDQQRPSPDARGGPQE
ncbi:MAG: type III secretion system stalk subunit SctO [Phyllobacterium sp.]